MDYRYLLLSQKNVQIVLLDDSKIGHLSLLWINELLFLCKE